MYNTLVIEYGDDHASVEYRLRDYPVVQRWAECLVLAQQQYHIDDPSRFYGFGDYTDQVQDALGRINQCITAIKLSYPEITRGYVESVNDQQSLNYWHHVFEVYHGLLEKQTGHDSESVLAELNISVHRCESVARGALPRHVVTYYGLPKIELLKNSDYNFFTDTWSAGTVFLNYAEIGKTMADLARDNDDFIHRTAFQPFQHISADFNVKFYAQTDLQAQTIRAKIHDYYNKNYQWLGSLSAKLQAEYLPLADIVGTVDLDFFKQRQEVKSVKLV
jgi:hypothetical protein